MSGRTLSIFVTGTILLVMAMGCGPDYPEYDETFEQQVEQGEFKMTEDPRPRINHLIIQRPWTSTYVIDCNDPGMKSCHECGAGDDGVICCPNPPCTVKNKPKSP